MTRGGRVPQADAGFSRDPARRVPAGRNHPPHHQLSMWESMSAICSVLGSQQGFGTADLIAAKAFLASVRCARREPRAHLSVRRAIIDSGPVLPLTHQSALDFRCTSRHSVTEILS